MRGGWPFKGIRSTPSPKKRPSKSVGRFFAGSLVFLLAADGAKALLLGQGGCNMFVGARLAQRATCNLILSGPRPIGLASCTDHIVGIRRKALASLAACASAPGVAPTKPSGKNKTLVIVESPAKARTITKLLQQEESIGGGSFVVDSCSGHVRNLVTRRKDTPEEMGGKDFKWVVIGIDVGNDFTPVYVVPPQKKTVVTRLRKLARECSEIILATDEDREGEAISWHLLQVLRPKVPVKRAVFHEITQDAITKAFREPRNIDMDLVKAQEARRVLDRLAGFTMSPLLWSTVSPGLSAGRVQSVGLAMIVERERRRLAFKSADYWDLVADLTTPDRPDRPFRARLVEVGGKAVVTGKDFDADTGALKGSIDISKVVLLEEKEVSGMSSNLGPLTTISVDVNRRKRNPPTPFITSTLQQEANRKLRLGVGRTMQAAQSLYEAGYITYMRTDNPTLSEEACQIADQAVGSMFGEDFTRTGEIPQAPKPKGSQEAHEAIRPAAPDGTFLAPAELPGSMEAIECGLYELVYRRTLASRMDPAEIDYAAVRLGGVVPSGEGETEVVFRASGKQVAYPGFMKAYEESSGADINGSDDGEESDTNGDLEGNQLLEIKEGDLVMTQGVTPARHKTTPPRRFTEASFVKELESEGVGRPSTYAAILEKLRARGYATLRPGGGRALAPSLVGFVVTDLLEKHFSDFTETGFTAQMETKLDEIAQGKTGQSEYLSSYYLGKEGLRERVARAMKEIDPVQAKRARVPGLEQLEGKIDLFVGPYGAYAVERDHHTGEGAMEGGGGTSAANGSGERGEPGGRGEGEGKGRQATPSVKGKKTTLPYAVTDDLDLLTPELVENAVEMGSTGGTVIGQHPETGEDVSVMLGSYGLYIQCGEKRCTYTHATSTSTLTTSAPTPNPIATEENDELLGGGKALSGWGGASEATSAVPLERALGLLGLPREVCEHPELGGAVTVGVGRFGPYVSYGGGYWTVPKGV
ncbi:unnamed protein product, partial [Discosporangium mesarthrocarpum]